MTGAIVLGVTRGGYNGMNPKPWSEVLNILPPLGMPEKESLRQSIELSGVQQAILVLPDGRIIDGHHRWELSGGTAPYTALNIPENKAFDLAIELNLARRQLSRAQIGLIRKEQKRRREQNKETARKMRAKGASQQEAAEAIGVSQQTVDKWEGEFTTITTDEDSGNSCKTLPDNRVKIPKTEHLTIFERYQAGDTQAQIAADYQVTQQAIARIIKREQKKADLEEEVRVAAEQVIVAPDRYSLICGDFAEVGTTLEPDSCDVIITDPPYGKDNVQLYGTLAQQATRILKPGGSLLAMAGQLYLPETFQLMTPHLKYHWTVAYLTPGGQAVQIWNRSVNTFWKPVLWFVKGDYSGAWVSDVTKSAAIDKRFDDWGQSESGMADLIERFSKKGDLILDPFCGTATTGVVAVQMQRRFIGIDIEGEKLETARGRISSVIRCEGGTNGLA